MISWVLQAGQRMGKQPGPPGRPSLQGLGHTMHMSSLSLRGHSMQGS